MTKTKAQIEAERVLENRRVAHHKRVRNLLGHVGQRTSEKFLDERFFALSDADRVEYGPRADALAAELASAEPVGRALHPAKVEAVKSAREKAEQVIERVAKELEEAGWDIDAVAPYPNSISSSTAEYHSKKNKYTLFHSLTRSASGTYPRRGEPRLVVMADDLKARFISNSEQDAAYQYDAFICKMVGKVGEVTDAQISGDHIWDHSILTVTLPSGQVQRWKTQQIVNYSVYGRPYLQWPSRIAK